MQANVFKVLAVYVYIFIVLKRVCAPHACTSDLPIYG